MAILPIVYIPDPRLREPVQNIQEFGDDLQRLIDDMFDTMHHARGVGLAAPQVGIAKNIAVIDITEDYSKPMVLINPEILERKDMTLFHEGCLSVPGHYDKLERANWVRVRALDRHGKSYELEAEGLLAECLQHEIDHLHAKLYIDYLPQLKQSIIRQKVEKFKKLEQRNQKRKQ
jgi:peptide deformylase